MEGKKSRKYGIRGITNTLRKLKLQTELNHANQSSREGKEPPGSSREELAGESPAAWARTRTRVRSTHRSRSERRWGALHCRKLGWKLQVWTEKGQRERQGQEGDKNTVKLDYLH